MRMHFSHFLLMSMAFSLNDMLQLHLEFLRWIRRRIPQLLDPCPHKLESFLPVFMLNLRLLLDQGFDLVNQLQISDIN